MADYIGSLEERVRERAFYLWEQAGAPSGREEEFWERAEAAEKEQAGSTDEVDRDSEESFPASDATNKM